MTAKKRLPKLRCNSSGCFDQYLGKCYYPTANPKGYVDCPWRVAPKRKRRAKK